MEEQIETYLKQMLSEKRYAHSVGVMKRAGELAKIYGVNRNEARLTGLLHDVAKEMPEEEKIAYCLENEIEIEELEKVKPSLLHAKIGADIAKKKYDFTTSMQNAILYHTTGDPDMDMLAKIIFIADKTEENRTFDGVVELRKLSEENINVAMIETIDFTILKAIRKKDMFHPASIYTRNALLMAEGNRKK